MCRPLSVSLCEVHGSTVADISYRVLDSFAVLERGFKVVWQLARSLLPQKVVVALTLPLRALPIGVNYLHLLYSNGNIVHREPHPPLRRTRLKVEPTFGELVSASLTRVTRRLWPTIEHKVTARYEIPCHAVCAA